MDELLYWKMYLPLGGSLTQFSYSCFQLSIIFAFYGVLWGH